MGLWDCRTAGPRDLGRGHGRRFASVPAVLQSCGPAVLVFLFLSGCGGVTLLEYAPPDPMLASLMHQDSGLGVKPERILLPCVVTVRHSDEARPSSGTVLPVKRVLRKAFDDAAREVFHAARGGTLAAFGVEITVQKQRVGSGGAAFDCTLGITLRSPRGRIMEFKQWKGSGRGGGGRGLPPGVWRAAYGAAFG